MTYYDTSFFLGSNTPSGFHSLFPDVFTSPKRRVFILKGGPGTGKSGLMKKAAKALEHEGAAVEKVYCSSDPESLDAVIFPQIDHCIVDGTSPHVLEPRLPGVCEEIVNLGEFWESDKLRAVAAPVSDLTHRCSAMHKRCVKFLDAACSGMDDIKTVLGCSVNREKLDRYTARLASRKFGSSKGTTGHESLRYINAVTKNGNMFFSNTAQILCDDIIILNDPYSIVSPLLINSLRITALENGYDVISGIDPLSRSHERKHLIVPETGFGIFTQDFFLETGLAHGKKVNAERFMESSAIKEHRQRVNFAEKMAAELLDEAYLSLEKAKGMHDELEKFYIDAMNFEKVGEKTEEIIKTLVDAFSKTA